MNYDKKIDGTALLNKKTIIALAVAFSIVFMILGYGFYKYQEVRIRNMQFGWLESIAKMKIQGLSDWYVDELEDAETLSRNPILMAYLSKWISEKNPSLRNELIKEIAAIREEHNYKNIILANSSGEILFSLDPNKKIIDDVVKDPIKLALFENKIKCTDLYLDRNGNEIELSFIAPLKNKYSPDKTCLIFVIDPNDFIYPLINRWPSSSKTAETILIKKEKDYAVVLNELRYKKNTALKEKIKLSDIQYPAVNAALGKEKFVAGYDYKGMEVISYLGPVPGTNWFMASKIDKDEIFRELNFRVVVIIAIVFLLILLSGSALAFIYNSRQKNIYKELYNTEKELWESHEEFKTTLYSIGDGVITTDIYGNIKQMNPEAERLTGWKENEAKNKSIQNVFVIVNELTRENVENPVNIVLAKGATVGLANHTILISRDGRETPIADSGAPIRNKDNEIFGVVLVFKDQSKEYQVQKTLEESEQRLRLALQASNQGIYDFNIKENILALTPEYFKMFGYDSADTVMKVSDWLNQLYPDDREKLKSVYKNYIEHKIDEYRIEFRQLTKNGDWKWILSLGKIVEIDENGLPNRMLGTYFDITDLKNFENELRDAKERAENSEKIKSEFLAQMSHEIRSPINIILSYVDLIRENIADHLHQELMPGFESIASAGQRIIRTIDLILNMSDLQLGTYEANHKSFNLKTLLENLVKEYWRPAVSKKIRLELKFEIENCHIISDEYAVNQIFANLIDNAVKYTPHGEISISVENVDSNNLMVKVADTGIGISDEYMATIFTPFSQEDHGYTRQFDGNGLGLSLVKKYCDLLYADISVESKKNVGTVFTVVFKSVRS